jgi:hypothetical protein
MSLGVQGFPAQCARKNEANVKALGRIAECYALMTELSKWTTRALNAP